MADVFWTFNVIDDFNREALAIDIDLNITAQRVVRALAEYDGECPHEFLKNLTPEKYRLMAEIPEILKSVKLKQVRLH